MAGEKVGFVIADAGMDADTHAAELKHIEDAELIATYARSEKNGNRFAEACGAQRWYDNDRRLPDDKDVDVVELCPPRR